MRLVKSNSRLQVRGTQLPGLPLFHPANTPEDVLANLWVVWGATTKEYLPKTSWAYTWALSDFRAWFSTSAPGVPWYEATETDVVCFKKMLAGAPGSGGRKLDPDTIALKLYGLDSAFTFVSEKNFIRAKPFRLSKDSGDSSASAAPSAIKVPNRTVPRVTQITAEQLFEIRAALPIRDEDVRRAFDSMVLFTWGSGTREMETVGVCRNKMSKAVREKAIGVSSQMPLREVFARTVSESFILELWPEHTKGGRGGTILIPRDLVKMAVDWMDYRPSKTTTQGFDPLYPSSRGKHYDPQTLGRYFRLAAAEAKIKVRFHAIRHTYGTRVVSICKTLGHEAMAEMFVQAQLRHRSRETTARYTNALEMRSHENGTLLAVNMHFKQGLMGRSE